MRSLPLLSPQSVGRRTSASDVVAVGANNAAAATDSAAASPGRLGGLAGIVAIYLAAPF
jgi:hypothetical protein